MKDKAYIAILDEEIRQLLVSFNRLSAELHNQIKKLENLRELNYKYLNIQIYKVEVENEN